MPCYDWESLKREFVLGSYRTLREFAEDKNISYGLLRNKAMIRPSKQKMVK
ncbi:hypothetical protein [Caldicellulosiruptor changbaiensis]|uniref:hypothetical protein n=1 Tax=Caldicellulosiruptor changbaiensis TaxID=1222016 RepID=UPI001F4986FE|nr:hypothetical protein [Caldicellulosiruptor changbaiensis]